MVCDSEGVELWLYSWLCICAREGGEKLTVYSWISVPEKGWKSGTFMSFWLDSGKYLCTIGLKLGQYSYIVTLASKYSLSYWKLEQT